MRLGPSLWAERLAGEMLARIEKHPGGRPSKNRRHDGTSLPAKLKEISVIQKQSSRWQSIAALRKKDFEGYIQENKQG